MATFSYALACSGAGVLVLRALAGHGWGALRVSGLPLLVTAFVLGQAVVAALWIPVALAGWFRPQAINGLLALLVVAGLPLLLPLARIASRNALAWGKWLWAEPFSLRIVAAALLLLVLGFGMAAWLNPPIGDAEAFYVVYARIIASTQRLEPMPGLYEAFSSIGLMGELHFAALIALSGVPAAKLYVWMLGLAAAALLASICGVAGIGRTGRLLATAMLFTSTAFTYHLFDGKVDLFAAALGLAAVLWILIPPDIVQRRAVLAVVGLCTGFAVVAKFSYVLGFVPVMLALVMWREMEQHVDKGGAMRGIVPALGIFGLWVVLAAVPHLFKNAALFGAPFAPFIGSSQDKSWLQQVWFTPEVTRQIVLTYPFALIFGRYPMQGGNLSWLLLSLLPLVWWLPRPACWRSSIVMRLCAAGGVGVLMWIVLRPSVIAPRYILATLLLFYPLVAKAAEQIVSREARPRWLSTGIAATFLAAFVVFSYPLLPVARYALASARGAENSCALASPYCEPLSKLSREAALGDRVYFAGYYSYWLRDDLIQCRDRGKESKQFRLSGGPGLSWEFLADGGFRWLVVDLGSHAAEWERLSVLPHPDYLVVRTFWSSKNMVILQLEDYRRSSRVVCQQASPPGWRPIVTQ